MEEVKVRIQFPKFSRATWESNNPVLLEGEAGYVADDPNLFKLGDGKTRWNDLPWRGYTGTIAQVLGDNDNAVISQKVTTQHITTSESRILELEKSQWPLVLTLELSSELIEYTNVNQPITVTYKVYHKGALKTPNTLTLTQDGVDLKAEVVQSKAMAVNVNKLGITEFILKAKAHSYYDHNSAETSDIIENTISKKLQMVLPIYAGFGKSATDVVVDDNKLSVRTSAAGTYSKTAAADGVNFFILVPATFTKLTSFTMGGAPFVMETSTITAGKFNQSYIQYKSGATYNTGATINIKAS